MFKEKSVNDGRKTSGKVFYISTDQFELEVEKKLGFPFCLLDVKNYDGFKFLGLIFLLLGGLYLLNGIAPDLNSTFAQLFNNTQEIASSTNSGLGWGIGSIFSGAKKMVSSKTHNLDIIFRVICFIFVWCLTWLIFDPKSLIGYAIGGFNILIGVIYTISPLDLIPDAIPVFGSTDDVVFGIGLVILGCVSAFKTNFAEHINNDIRDSIQNNDIEQALKKFFKETGYTVNKIEKNNPQL